eukprot:COSAG02_NODE_192_length_29942_cov_34.627228_17_plen_131_part_00
MDTYGVYWCTPGSNVCEYSEYPAIDVRIDQNYGRGRRVWFFRSITENDRVLLPNCACCARLGVSKFHLFLSARNMSLNFFGTDCAQVFNFPSCPNVRNTHGSVGNLVREAESRKDHEGASACGFYRSFGA